MARREQPDPQPDVTPAPAHEQAAAPKKERKKGRGGKRKGAGRKNVFADANTRKAVLKMLADGHSRQDAADMLGFSRQTLTDETARDKEFGDRVRQAEAKGKVALVARLIDGSKKDPKWAAWMLERKYWQDWARRDPANISPGELIAFAGKLVSVLLVFIPPEQQGAARAEIDRVTAELAILAR